MSNGRKRKFIPVNQFKTIHEINKLWKLRQYAIYMGSIGTSTRARCKGGNQKWNALENEENRKSGGQERAQKGSLEVATAIFWDQVQCEK